MVNVMNEKTIGHVCACGHYIPNRFGWGHEHDGQVKAQELFLLFLFFSFLIVVHEHVMKLTFDLPRCN
jgi:hypothetical protein